MATSQDLLVHIRVNADGTATFSQVAGQIEGVGNQAEKAGKKTESMFQSVLKAGLVQDALRSLTSFFTESAGKAIALGDALGEVGGSFERLSQEAGLSGSQIVSSMREASDGLVTDIGLMTNANDLLGTKIQMSAEQFGQLTSAAKLLGEAHGVDLPQAMDAFTAAIAKGSDKALIALGVDIDLKAITDALGDSATEAERKQAIFAAVLEKSAAASSGLKQEGDSLNDGLQRLSVTWDNYLARLGAAMNETQGMGGAIDWLRARIDDAAAGIPVMLDGISGFFRSVADGITRLTGIISGGIETWKRNAQDLMLTLGLMSAKQLEIAPSIDREVQARSILVKVAKEQGILMAELRAGYKSDTAAVAGLAKQQDSLGIAVRAAIKDGKEHVTTLAKTTTETAKTTGASDKLSTTVAALQKEYASLTSTQKQHIVEALKVGLSTADIAKQTGLAEQTVGRYAKELDEASKKSKDLAEKQKKLAEELKKVQDALKPEDWDKFIDSSLKAADATNKLLDALDPMTGGGIADDFSEIALKISAIKTPLDEDAQSAVNTADAFEDLGLTMRATAEEDLQKFLDQLALIAEKGGYIPGELAQKFEEAAARLKALGEPISAEFQKAWDKIKSEAAAAAGETKDVWKDTLADLGSLVGNLVDGIIGAFMSVISGAQSFGSAMKNVFSGILNNLMRGLSQNISGWLQTFVSNLSKGFSGAAGAANASFGKALLAGAKFIPIVAWGYAIGRMAYEMFRQRNPMEAVSEELVRQMGLGLFASMPALKSTILQLISQAFGGIKGGELENKIAIGIYIPEVQMLLFQEQLKMIVDADVLASEVERFADIWMNRTMPVLVNEFGMTQEAAAKAMEALIQKGLNELLKQGVEVGKNMADLVTWAVKLGAELDTAGQMVRDVNGELITLNAYITRMAGIEIFMKKWTDGFTQLKKELANWLNVRDFETRVKGIGDVLAKFFADQLKRIRDMINEGLSADQLANIANQIMPQLKAIADYQLKALNAMQAAGMSTTEIWNSVGLAMQKQIALMRELGLEGTAAFKKLLEQFKKLRDDAQLIAGMVGPMVSYFQKLAETGQLTAKNFEKWTGVALSYLQRMIEAGATTAEVWQALSGIYDVLKAKHDEVMGKIEDQMSKVLDNNKKLTDAQKQAIEDYVNGVKGSLEALAAMGVPQSLLDQIQKWREMRDLVSGPVWEAFEKFYAQQKELQKWTSLMDQINALFAAMGTNLITNVDELKTWSDEIQKYFKKMMDGGMSLQQIVSQYGGSLHQLYLEYVALEQDVPGWLKKIEAEYQKQEAARKAADDAQLAAQIAMLQAMAALIQAIGGDIPDAIQDAIDALQKLRDAANGVDPSIDPGSGPGGPHGLAGSIDETRDAALDAAAAVLDIKAAIQNTTKEGGKFYEKMKVWLDKLTDMVDDLRVAFKGSGVHAALLACRDAAGKFGDTLSDALRKAKKDTDDEDKKLEKLAKRLEQIKTAAGGIGNILSGGISAGLVGPADISSYLGLAQKMISMLTAKGASFGDIFAQLQTYGATLEESWKTPLAALTSGMDSDVQKAIEDYVTGKAGLTGEVAQMLITQGIMPQIEAIKATFEQIANSPLMALLTKFQSASPYMQMVQGIEETVTALGKKIGKPMYSELAGILMQDYAALLPIFGDETVKYLKSTLGAFAALEKSATKGEKVVPKAWRSDIPGFADLMSAGGYRRGLSYVPYDMYPAWLHKGERVLTAEENKAGKGGQVTLNVNITTPDAAAMDRYVQSTLIPRFNRALKDNVGGFRSYVQEYAT